MAKARFLALEQVSNRTFVKKDFTKETISKRFGENVFDLDKIRSNVSESAYEAIYDAMYKGKTIDQDVANQVASGMRAWAIEKGATHVTHWFQPMTGLTAEKHDSFLHFTDTGRAIEQFDGSVLVQQEPDASSFPSGGVRQTFEARGYSAWDPSSPAFILEQGGGRTLCIPSIFVSYSGEALDKKTPLLRSIDALNLQATETCQFFDKNVKRVTSTLGCEQEYFLIDKSFYQARPDLMASGRTVFGVVPAKGQQLDDHYFGSIKERAFAFMNDFESEAYKVGIPLKTRHNEVAPHQFECAPIFEEANIAVDHNALLIDIMEKVGMRHDLKVLLHEKPFAGINGSGKHNNWSLQTDTGKNLFSPGKSPQDNLQFLLFLVSTLKAVHGNAELMRAAIANSGNDHRLGANEAPPAIISIFLGEQLTEILDHIEKGEFKETDSNRQMSFGISKIPTLSKDNTDRNRTSPFAFTGNKFEFRAVGSTANSALPVYCLNTLMADALKEANKTIKEKIAGGLDKKNAIIEVIKEFIIESKNIRFEGNGYSEDWVKEAEKKGLPNIKSSPEAYEAFISDKTKRVFSEHNVLSEVELESRFNVKIEKFVKDIQIEANIAKSIAKSIILPSCMKYQRDLVSAIQGLKEVLGSNDSVKGQEVYLENVSKYIASTIYGIDGLVTELNKAESLIEKDEVKAAKLFDTKVKPAIDNLRMSIDKLENMVDNELWPLPKYYEMLFLM